MRLKLEIILFGIIELMVLVQDLNEENNGKRSSFKNLLVRIENDGSVRKIDLEKIAKVDELGPPISKIPSKKIVGGKFSSKGSVPYQINFNHFGGTRCGGTIYNNLTVLTSAHCFIWPGPDRIPTFMKKEIIDQILVIAGDYDSLVPDAEEQSVKIASVIYHPKYDPAFDYDDIAIVKLQKPLILNEHVQALPIGYPPIEPESVGFAIISGWGYTKMKKIGAVADNAYFPNILKEAKINVFTKDQCANFYKNYNALKELVVKKGHICAGTFNGSDDACQGDSGGPLACIDPASNKRFLCGIITTGLGCGVPGIPGVYTRVAAYQEWIIEQTGYAPKRKVEKIEPQKARNPGIFEKVTSSISNVFKWFGK